MDAALLDVRSVRPYPVRPFSISTTKFVFLSLAILAWVNSTNAALAKGHHGGHAHKGGHEHKDGHEHAAEAGHEAHHEHDGEHRHGEHEGRHHDAHAAGWANGPGGYGYRYWNGTDWTWDYKRRVDRNDVIIEERRIK